ncbi:adenomatous polyposis coli protein-like isoform X1 [Coregonus clupeaformis]|uniref:adenomatous polyposis coli protein-like isoform X1 n=1 Tax=Coregonus clupeaformis TaxID=59861 RepID=UPI001E1C8A67|nr:adenomatous polyposis coli protein-like isoform X1 [Coregonus clupeaformis]XP_041754885.2 adenomatous polyposis coli protein-like isoform X1 [Coregonus clupeaformis]XP_041754886.2 adenomatous polyposis coli protein-like isoform X1 [Coregonus clupeaformis]XP_041754888.2 adenomatous polyposis coli protein-like isoform X1 [Coregonus clupeaformis]
MAAASYDQLLKQVEVLKMENSNLRQELEDNSNHLTKLETEASNMKEVLKHLQGSIEEDSTDSSEQINLLERLKEISLDPNSYPGVKLRPKPPSMQGSGSGRSGDSSPSPSPSPMGSLGSFPRRGVSNGGQDSAGYLEELEKERSLLMAELEKEEKEKDWYYAQLQNLTKRIDSLPLTENQFSLQTDMTRRQLEYEARQIRAAMEEQLGTCQDMEKRAQVRVARIQQIEKDMLKVRQYLQSQSAEPESKHDQAGQSEGPQASGDSGGPSAGCSQGSSSRLDHDSASEISLGVGSYSVPRRLTSHLGTKVEMVYSLLSMLGTHDKDDMSRTLLAMSSSQDSCIAMRQSGCLPLLIQLLHGNDKDSVLLGNSRGSKEARARASAALHNIIHSQPDDKRGRREIRVLHLLEQIRVYCETCWEWQESHERGVDQDKNPMPSPVEHQICPAVCVLMKLSFDEEHRHAMNELGGLQAIGELLQVDCEIYGLTSDHYSVTLRRYAGMALTNLTFGDVANKATLCSMKGCMRAMVAQLKSESEDLQQVIASVLRNLSWRADVNSKKTLREVGSVRALMECALEVQKESTLKSVLSALWNLSAHCTENKADICAVEGALAFLVSTLTYRSQTNTLAIIESGGGILRNVSSLIATNEDHRQILRENSCLQTLLQHLKSHSLTIVSNACGTLWNLSARNAKDQEALWDMGAVSMLKNLIHSKHKMIAMGSAAALRNLMANRPAKYKDANIMSPGSSLPSLHVRKQKALIEELDSQQLSETFDNIDNLSPKASHRGKPSRHKQNVYSDYDGVSRSDGFSPNSVPVRSPYVNTPVLSSPSPRENPRGNIDSVRAERDRSQDRDRLRGAPGGFHPDHDSKRMQMPATTAAQIAMVMEEVKSIHLLTGLDDRSPESPNQDPHRTTAAHGHSNIHPSTKPDHSGRTCPMPKLEYRASNDSLNSVNSTDGYGKRGQMKPSVDTYSEDDEGKCCVYRKYPADLAHKIHNANHMEDDDGEVDTPINYSLKYSDEQLNSGRQSPSQNERWARPKHMEEEMKRTDQRSVRSQSPGYPMYTEGNCEGKEKLKYKPRFVQTEMPQGFRSRNTNQHQQDQSNAGPTQGINKKMNNQTMCQSVDDYGDDKPTNYNERYSEEEQQDEQPTNYSMKYNEEHHAEQPIDYSLKYSDSSSQKSMFSHSKSSSTQSSVKEHLSQDGSTSSVTSIKNAGRQMQLHPSSAQTRSGPTRPGQKNTICKPPTVNQETLQTYCVEDTPICFSRGSSLSSLSSEEDEMEGCKRNVNAASNYPTLPISEKDSTGGQTQEQRTTESQSSVQYVRMKPPRNSQVHGDGSRHHKAEFSSGAKSPSKSGAQTPKSPPEHYAQETPLMFSRCTSVSSLDSFESHSIASSIQSELCSGMPSGIISPSDLPDSPGQTMPPSRSKTPPPPQHQHPPPMKHKKVPPPPPPRADMAPRHAAVHTAVQKVQVLPDNDALLHFATESTPEGFSCASSLSALSLDEPYIQKDNELKIMPPVHEDDQGNEAEHENDDTTEPPSQEKRSPGETEKDILDDSDDDDIEILEACINSAMPTKSSRKPKKQSPSNTTSRIPPPTARKPSQLPVYKLLPSQTRGQQKTVNFAHGEDMPRVYCVEGTPINFSTATSLSDLTIDSPPNELANAESCAPPRAEVSSSQRRDTIPEGKSTEEKDAGVTSSSTQAAATENEGDDILAECISSAMPKGKIHKPFRIQKMYDQPPHPSASPVSLVQQEVEKKPTSPVKPMPQSSEYRARMIKKPQPPFNFSSYSDKNKETKMQEPKMASRDFTDKPPNAEEGPRPGFAFDSPQHYTPIEGTPYCFSRNDSLSSLDFEDDEPDLAKEKAELRKDKDQRKASTKNSGKPSLRANRSNLPQTAPTKPLQQKQAVFPQASKENMGPVPDEKQKFSIEDTPMCFSRNSSLSSLSDIDQENNNKDLQPKEEEDVTQVEAPVRPQVSGYTPKAFHVEDTPVCFSRNSSLSSLSIDSEDDLLQECISSAMPKKKKQTARNKGGNDQGDATEEKSMDGILAEEPDLILDLTDTHSPVSEQALSPDSESFDWKAIQEGANSIVSSLHQAAASLSRQGSSDSDSILSLKSGISLGSPFHLPLNSEDNKSASDKAGRPRILKPGEKSTLEAKKKEKEEEAAKALKGGKKVYKSLITGKPRAITETPASLQQRQTAPTVPISRGRTMIHVPGVRSSSPSTSPVQKKPPARGPASVSKIPPTQGQCSSNSHRSIKPPAKSDPSPARDQPGSQSGSSKASSRSGSRDSTPSRPAQQSLTTRPMQSPGRTSVSPGRNGLGSSNKLSQIPRTASPSTSSTKSSCSGRMSYTSPGRQMGQQTPPKQTGLTRSTSGIPRSESASKSLNQCGVAGTSKKQDLSRMSSTKSSGSESDRSEKPALVRQSTFIKEAPSPTLKRKLEESASFESLSPSSTSQSQTPVSSPSLPDMSLTLPYQGSQGSNWKKSPQSQNSSENEDGKPQRGVKHDISRSHSESPSRLPNLNRTGTWKRENSKHSSSLPRVGTWKRTGSSSSILSASSESSEKGKSEDERQPLRSPHGKDGNPLKGTWRKMKDSEISQSEGHDSSSMDSNTMAMGHQMSPAVSKTEDVWVRIEDCPINSPRSVKSPTANTPPVIDSVLVKMPSVDLLTSETHPKQCKTESVNARRLGSETNLNLFRSSESLDKKGPDLKPAQSIIPEAHELPVAERTPFSSSNSSKHSSPSGAVAARVSPFNYTPSPRKSSADSATPPRPSQIPTPISVTNSAKKRESKGESAGESGSYIVTSV